MNKNNKLITNSLKLRTPQHESLEIFETICDKLMLKKNVNLEEEEKKVQQISMTFKGFEREFPSICFSLATGVGKTRLMGAFIAYLYYEKGIKNFFVMAPNLTIYNKLKADFGNNSHQKYVFKGLDAFSSPPRIIDGDNYEDFRQQAFGHSDVIINIFNISKLNSDSKGKAGQPPRIKRLNEVLGDSYFQYLVERPDLVLLMDESHHYRADRGMTVINELKPILGIEVTATPQVQKGSKSEKFQNVVYEYSLAHALDDGEYVKVPVVATRENFLADQYDDEQLDKLKLEDGIKVHIDTQAAIEKYARENGRKMIKPVVLVVAKDTAHSARIKEHLCSDSFFKGYYKNKVLEINSNQSGFEKEENIQDLLSLEDINNKKEIVIHVNMLKEGWDVNNLYTIIPLRSSASETLTEQTIGRGLRLPYGERTGEEKVDRLTIVHHDKFQAILDLANDPNSLVRKYYFIDPEENKNQERKSVVLLPSTVENLVASISFAEQIAMDIPDSVIQTPEKKNEVAQFISQTAYKTTMELNKVVKNFDDIKKDEYQDIIYHAVVQKTKEAFPNIDVKSEAFQKCAQNAVKRVSQIVTDNVIPIPQGTVQQKLEIIEGFYEFDLDTRNINFQPSSEIIKTKALTTDGKVSYIDSNIIIDSTEDTSENLIIKDIINHDNVDYEKNADLIYNLMGQLKQHFRSYLNEEDMLKVMEQRRKDLGDIIYAQMNEHFYKKETRFEAGEMRPFSKIEVGCGEKFDSEIIYNFRVFIPPSEVVKKIFEGFKKSSHSLYKFKNNTEKSFAVILEDDDKVLKWMCPNKNQFKMYWDKYSKHLYQPDFIVETAETIFMVETKDKSELTDEVVLFKARAGIEYCRAATAFNLKYGGKQWKYAIVPHDVVKDGMSFEWLMMHCVKVEI